MDNSKEASDEINEQNTLEAPIENKVDISEEVNDTSKFFIKLKNSAIIKNKKLMIIASIALIILISLISVYIVSTKQYTAEVELIKSDIAVFKEQLNSNEFNNLWDATEYYQQLKKNFNYSKVLEELNDSKKYLLVNKETVDTLEISDIEEQLQVIANNKDVINSFKQKNSLIDKEILLLEDSTDTYGGLINKYEELVAKNNTLRDDVVALVLPSLLADYHEDFIDALNYREKFLNSMANYLQAEVDFLDLTTDGDYYYDLANQYYNKAQNAYYLNDYYYYYEIALDYLDTSDGYYYSAEMRYNEAQLYLDEARSMLNKYRQAMNIVEGINEV